MNPCGFNGDKEIRTLDPLLARQVLSQLSYVPKGESGSRLLSHAVSSIVPSAVQGLTVVFGMGTGVPPARIAAGCLLSMRLSSGLRFLRFSLLILLPPSGLRFLRTFLLSPLLPLRIRCLL